MTAFNQRIFFASAHDNSKCWNIVISIDQSFRNDSRRRIEWQFLFFFVSRTAVSRLGRVNVFVILVGQFGLVDILVGRLGCDFAVFSDDECLASLTRLRTGELENCGALFGRWPVPDGGLVGDDVGVFFVPKTCLNHIDAMSFCRRCHCCCAPKNKKIARKNTRCFHPE